MKHTIKYALAILATGSASLADTIFVDAGGGGDYLTIQEGIDNALPGDTVVVLYLADQEGAVKKLFKRSLF